MKLLNTIQRLIKEAENNYYDASLFSDDPNEIDILSKNLEDCQNLLELYENIKDDYSEEDTI